ncbi:MAG: AMP-binding protein [Crocinitomix sp.]|nr:AMP-binding protein [Crocinitomix sp.]
MKLLTQIFSDIALSQPDKTAFIFLKDGEEQEICVSYSALWEKVNKYGGSLSNLKLFQKPVLLLYPTGIEYVEAFLSCLSAGVIAIPVYPPRSSKHADRLVHILENSGATTILTTKKSKEKLDRFDQEILDKCQIICLEDCVPNDNFKFENYQSEENIAFIQYTSGSTGNPKGVIVSNKNLISNQEQIKQAILQDSTSVIVSWLPMYHDMGLIGNILHNVYIGAMCVFFAPAHFLQSPLRWLKAITKYKATLSGAPNFAYDLLNKIDLSNANLDLSSLEIAFNGAEKVRYDTVSEFLARFKKYGLNPNAIYPCYGLAEATLMVAGYDKNEGIKTIRTNSNAIKNRTVIQDEAGEVVFVSSGKVRAGCTVLILNDNGDRLETRQIGTIYISGANVTQGYWNRNESEFSIEYEGSQFINTGDLGCLIDQHLYITGRKKEIIIHNGVNYYPYDIERIVTSSHSALTENGCAVFSIDSNHIENIIVAVEINRSHYRKINESEIYSAINGALSSNLGLTANDIVLLSPMSISKTSSGKIQRSNCKLQYLENKFKLLGSLLTYSASNAVKQNIKTPLKTEERVDNMLLFLEEEIAQILGEKLSLAAETKLHEIGLDSIKLMMFTASLEQTTGVKLNLDFIFDDITIGDLITELKQENSPDAEAIEIGQVSANQQGLWLAVQNGLTENQIGFSFKIRAKRNQREKLNKSLKTTLENLGYSATNFVLENGGVNQVFNLTKLFHETYHESEQKYRQAIIDAYKAETDLEKDSLSELHIFYDAKKALTEVTFIVHHIVTDGWSLAILFEHWIEILKGKKPIKKNVSKDDILAEETRAINNQSLMSNALNLFSNIVAYPNINGLLSQVEYENKSVGHLACELNKDTLFKLAAAYNVSPFIIILSSYHLALSYLTSNEQICTVSPFSSRASLNRLNEYGYLVNLMYLKSEVNEKTTFSEFIALMNSYFKKTLKYQSIPYTHLLRASNPAKETTNALGLFYFAYQAFDEKDQFQKLFEKEEKYITTLEAGCDLYNSKQHIQKGNFKMELEVFECSETLTLDLKYNESHFSKEIANSVIEVMNTLFEQMEIDQNKALRQVRFLETETIDTVLKKGFGRRKEIKQKHFLDLFQKSLDNYPNRTAIEQGTEKLTYAMLNEKSDNLASVLVNTYKLKRGECVLLHSSFNLLELIAILGIMKAGGVYVPVDQKLPLARQKLIVADCQIRFGFSDVELPFFKQLIIEDLIAIAQGDYVAEWSNKSYVIYTSGTTGVPKGVLINQRGLVNLCYAMIDAYDLDSEDAILQFSSLSFDMSVEEIFPYLAVGAKVVMRKITTIESLSNFANYCDESSISILNLPTTFWEECIAITRFPKKVRTIAVGGESMNLISVKNWFQSHGDNIKLFNAYGPTEYTVNATLKEINPKLSEITVGTPILNTQVFILNKDKKILPNGVVGELVLAGNSLADGYLNREAVLGTGFSSIQIQDKEGTQVYATGDLGFKNSENEIIILGRKDAQVKIRGFRIELGAIEAIIEENTLVNQAIALVHKKALCVFVAVNNASFSIDDCKKEMAAKLPHYFVPDQIFVLEKIPVNVQGKIDKNELIKMIQFNDFEIILPTTDIEIKLFNLWKTVLEVSDFGITQNFHELGGHSINAIKLLTQIEMQLGKKISLKTFYETGTIKKLSQYIETVLWIEKSKDEFGEKQDEILI